MTEKKKMLVTGPEKIVADALPSCAEKTAMGLRIKSAFRCVSKYCQEKGIKASSSTIYRGLDRLVSRKILEPVEKRRVPGEKRPSILYHFNRELYDSYDFEVVGRTRKSKQPVVKKQKRRKTGLQDLVRRTMFSYAEVIREIRNKKSKLLDLQREKTRIEKEVIRLERELQAFEKFFNKIKK